MKEDYYALININGTVTAIDCAPEMAIDGQKVMLSRLTGEEIRGKVSGRELGEKETVLGIGRVRSGKISMYSGDERITIDIVRDKKMLLANKSQTLPILQKDKKAKLNRNVSAKPHGLRLKAIKD